LIVRFVPFEPQHLVLIEAQPAQAKHLQWMTPEIAEAAAAHYAFTAIDDLGRLVGCAGMAPAADGIVAWAIFSDLIKAYPVAIFRALRRTLEAFRFERVVMHIHTEHAKASRLAEALHFRFLEARADLHPSGSILHVYVREGV
jgi:hypothetical protein